MAYYIKISGKAFGPLNVEKLSQLISSGKVNRNTEISTDKASWEPLDMYPELMGNSVGTQQNDMSSSLGNGYGSTGPQQFAGNGYASTGFQQPAGNGYGSTDFQQFAGNGYADNTQWYFSNDNTNMYGPYPSSAIINFINTNHIHAQTLIWREGDNSSYPISNTPEFASFFANGYNANSYNANSYDVNGYDVHRNSKPKSRTTYILLGLFLGEFGAHNFYAGYKAKGTIQLLCTILSCGILLIPMGIWALIEICTVREDVNGVPFQD